MAQTKHTKQRGVFFLIIAVFLALFTGMLVLTFMTDVERQIGETVAVLRVKKDIAADTVIDASLIRSGAFDIEQIPIKWAPTTVYKVPTGLAESYPGPRGLVTIGGKDVERLSEVIDRVTLVRLRPDDVLQTNYLHSYAGLEPGFRAVTIAVNSETGVGGVVRGGNLVDIIVSWEEKTADGKTTPQTRLVLQNVKVLAVGSANERVTIEGLPPEAMQDPSTAQAVSATAATARFLPSGEMVRDTVVTLALKPEDAVKLTYMVNFSKEVRLMFRRPGEQGLAPDILIGPSNMK